MNKVILALDNMDVPTALSIALETKKDVWGYKINDLLIDQGKGVVSTLRNYGKVMADPKLADIPNTINNSLKKLHNAGANIVTVHCAAQFVPDDLRVAATIAGITVLTTFTDSNCLSVYGKNIKHAVLRFAEWANYYKYGYLVCSGKDLEHGVRSVFSGTIICPAIRPKWSIVEGDDQERIVTPEKAIRAGAHLLVMGRPITQASSPLEALKRTNEEISKIGE